MSVRIHAAAIERFFDDPNGPLVTEVIKPIAQKVTDIARERFSSDRPEIGERISRRINFHMEGTTAIVGTDGGGLISDFLYEKQLKENWLGETLETARSS